MNYINVNELQQLLIITPGLALIDVRSPEEYQAAHVPEATLVSLDTMLASPDQTIEKILELLGDQETLYIICLSDRRSFMACNTLAKHNFLNTCFIKGGTQDWIASGYPVVSGS